MTYNFETINLFIYKAINNIPFNKISKELDISPATITLWNKKYNDFIKEKKYLNQQIFNDINYSKIHGLNKSHKYIDNITNYVNKNTGCSLKNIQNEINKELSLSTIFKILKKNNFSHKKINNNIIYKNIEEIDKDRIKFVKNLTKENFCNLLCTDESSFNINQIKNYGYSKKGEAIVKNKKHKRTKDKRSLISIISINKILTYNIYNKTVNGEDYYNFLKSNVEILKNKTLLLDNARIHHYKKVKKFANENNITLLYNAPYSPLFNPIELIFGEIKKYFRNLEHINIDNDIHNSINNVNNNIIKNLYEHCWKKIEEYKKLILI